MNTSLNNPIVPQRTTEAHLRADDSPLSYPGVCEMMAALHKGGKFAYWATIDSEENWNMVWWEVGKFAPLPGDRDVYFSVHPTFERGTSRQRSKKEGERAVAVLNCLLSEHDGKDYVDVSNAEIFDELPKDTDPTNERAWKLARGKAQEKKFKANPEPYKALALAHIQELPCQPSILIDSGGGFHVYHLLSEPWVLDTPEERARAVALQDAWVSFVGGDPGSKDLARVLRVPLTWNMKYDPPQQVLFEWADLDMRYDLADLEALAKSNIKPEVSKRKAHDQERNLDGDRPGDQWAAVTKWSDILEKDGARRLYERGDVEMWQRPGKEGKGGSATVNYGGSDLLYVFTSAWPDLDVGKSYTKFGAYTALYHNGDYKKATLALVAQGFGKKADEKKDSGKKEKVAMVDNPPTLNDTYDAFARGQMGDAELLAKLKGGKILYDHSERQWYLWTGQHWEKDRCRKVDTYVGNELAALYLTAAAEQRKLESEAAQAFSKKLQARAGDLYNKSRRDAVLDQAMTLDGLKITGDEWDTDPWKLGVENGVIDLHTGELTPGKPSDYVRSTAPVTWTGLDTPCPTWERFLREILIDMPNEKDGEAKVEYVHRLLGYGITGLREEHVFPIFWGDTGRNGKGTLKEVLSTVLGINVVKNTPATSLMESKHRDGQAPMPFLYDLQGKRLVFASELNEGTKIDLALIKLLAGGDSITARTLHSTPKTFVPSHLLTLITNPRPKIDADDAAVWDRVSLIEFNQRFVDKPQGPNEHKRDTKLDQKLLAEKSGILAWLVRGCLEWQAKGLAIPECVRASTKAYREDEDTFSGFVEECIVEESKARLHVGPAYKSYVSWATEAGFTTPLSSKDFQKKMRARFWVDENGKPKDGKLEKDNAGYWYPDLKTTNTVTTVSHYMEDK